jgi:NTP pyrophosphatase (non-canonical NTP hydrolase)
LRTLHVGRDTGYNARMEISEAQASVDAYISQFAEGYWAPLSNLARLTEEVGELAREMNHRFGQKPKKAGEAEQDLALELADIMFVIIVIANQQKIDLDSAFRQVIAKYDTRDKDRWTRIEQP